MNHNDNEASCNLHRVTGVIYLILLLCICVVTQMIGLPVTLLGLLDYPDMLEEFESASEDFSVLSPSLAQERPSLLCLFAEIQPVNYLPVLLASVFRPPTI
jgi:hypothetical protein